MADNIRSKITVKDIRTSRFLFLRIKKMFPETGGFSFDGNNPDTSLSERVINSAFETGIPDPIQRSIVIKNLELEIHTIILPEKYFNWLKDNERATFWLWGNIYLNYSYMRSINEAINHAPSHDWYETSRLTNSPAGHIERYSMIVALLDYISIEKNAATPLREWLNEKLISWRQITLRNVKLKWLKLENPEACLWAYNYIKKYQEKRCSEGRNKLNPVQLPEPLNIAETYHAVYAMLDLWSVDEDIKQKLVNKINRAFYQKNFRRKRAEKRGREDISEVHIGQLKSLMQFYKLDKASVIEMLIDDRMRGVEARLSRR